MSEPGKRISEAEAKQRFGDDVSSRRVRLGLSRAECASKAKVSLSELSEIEAGCGEPKASSVARVAEALGCDTDDLMGGMRWVLSPAGDGGGHFEVD